MTNSIKDLQKDTEVFEEKVQAPAQARARSGAASGVRAELCSGFGTAFIDKALPSDPAYRPQFISNDHREGRKVLSLIEDELRVCDSFCISVAFITLSGIEPLLQTLRELEAKGVPGRILTTDYLNFSEPAALDKLQSLRNIDLRMYRTEGHREGFHTKGYIFRKNEIYNIIIGSSNMTAAALTVNREWNTRVVSGDKGEFPEQVIDEFRALWSDERTEKYTDFIDRYRIKYKAVREQRRRAAEEEVTSLARYRLQPNSMQVEFIRSLNRLIDEGAQKALLISATGTGKTYASAFALREQEPGRILFIVHREQIARQAMASYRNVFGSGKKFGLISGSSRDYNADYVFSTMQMMAKEETLQRYAPDEFDIIVIDEVHRAGASSYQKIMEYFCPGLWLGMTASPERTDGYDIYKAFDHNIAYEIRLQQALEEDLLCPFHYFGISDISVNGEILGDNRDFSALVCDERVEHVIREAEYYGYSGKRVKGLVFCSRKDEARELSAKFNERGYRTLFLSGADPQDVRENAVMRLTADRAEPGEPVGTRRPDLGERPEAPDDGLLDYIFTIDIFNEGVDIPEINQVIMLRPTESPIIFVQQLGRGLRKAEDKDFVVVLDFIGNYQNNFMIPIALSGDRSYNKDNMRKYVAGGTRVIPGSSSIHFDEIARSRIYASIDAARTNDIKLLRDSYNNLKHKLGRVPGLLDFARHDAVDVTKIFDKCGSYYNFLVKYDKDDYPVRLSDDETKVIEFLSTKLASGKRIHELKMLEILLERRERVDYYFRELMQKEYGITLSGEDLRSTVSNLSNRFSKATDREKYAACVFVDDRDSLRVSAAFEEMLKNQDFADMVRELIDFGIHRYKENYADRYKDTNFELYRKYTYEDVCRLLNWKTSMNAQNIGGYFYDKETKTLPVFINYDKAEDAIAYEDRFVSNSELIALSKHPRKTDSTDADHFYRRTPDDKDNRIYLFVRKNKDDKEAKEFYFLGEINAVGEPRQIRMKTPNGRKDDAFEIDYRLDVPVRDDVYSYIIGE